MEQVGLVARIEQGKFLLLGLTPERVLSNPLYIGCNLITPAYISFWSALHYHGFTEQVPRTTFVATTHRKKEIALREMNLKVGDVLHVLAVTELILGNIKIILRLESHPELRRIVKKT